MAGVGLQKAEDVSRWLIVPILEVLYLTDKGRDRSGNTGTLPYKPSAACCVVNLTVNLMGHRNRPLGRSVWGRRGFLDWVS